MGRTYGEKEGKEGLGQRIEGGGEWSPLVGRSGGAGRGWPLAGSHAHLENHIWKISRALTLPDHPLS